MTSSSLVRPRGIEEPSTCARKGPEPAGLGPDRRSRWALSLGTIALLVAAGSAPAHARGYFDPKKPKPITILQAGYGLLGTGELELELDGSSVGSTDIDDAGNYALSLAIGFPYTDEIRFGVAGWLLPSVKYDVDGTDTDAFMALDANATAEYLSDLGTTLGFVATAEAGLSLLIPPEPAASEPELDTFWGYNAAASLGLQLRLSKTTAARLSFRYGYYDVSTTYSGVEGEWKYILTGTRAMVTGGMVFF